MSETWKWNKGDWLKYGNEEEVTKAVKAMVWEPKDKPIPMSPGLVCRALQKALEIRWGVISRVGYSIEPVRCPDSTMGDPEEVQLVGLEVRCKGGDLLQFFALDLGVGFVVPLQITVSPDGVAGD